MSEKVNCVECRHFYGFDGVNELWTGCSIHGDFKGKKITCDHFEKKVTKDDLFKKIRKQQAIINKQQDLIEELYDFRLTYNALLFNEWAENQKYEVYKSRRHSDGELCFDGEYFIIVANLPTGQVTNHYHIMHWDMFKINEYEKVKEDFDGHTSSDVIERLQQVIDV